MEKIPEHIAIIMDGNGRWAKKHGLPRAMGHREGSKVVRKICEAAYQEGVKYLTVYAFSTENWSRPKDEIDTLMKILRNYLKDALNECEENNMRVRIIGDPTILPADMQEQIRTLMDESKKYTGLQFQIALNYGGKDELLRAVKKISEDFQKSGKNMSEITEQDIEEHLDTRELPNPDLIIRTSGEQRLSNFLMWQSAYTEYYFTDTLWPDFDRNELHQAIISYQSRDRRFGGRKEE